MKKHLSIDQLSGYLDGELGEDEKARRHLAECPLCLGRHKELSRLMEHLRSIPETEVRPDFADRVMSTIERREARHRPVFARFAMPALAAATVILAVATMFGVYSGNSAVAPVTTLAASIENEQALFDRLERMVAEGPVSSPLLETAIVDDARPAVAGVDDMLLALAGPQWFETVAATWVEEEDFDSTVTRLTENETEMLKAILREYAEEAGSI